jgi:hypothetical protein
VWVLVLVLEKEDGAGCIKNEATVSQMAGIFNFSENRGKSGT